MVMLMHGRTYHASTQPETLHDWGEESDVELDDSILDDDPATTDMAYDHRQETYADIHSFPATSHAAWQEMSTNNETMQYGHVNQHHYLPTNPTHYHHPVEQTADYNPGWQHQHSSVDSTPHSAVFNTYPSDPIVKGEDGYNHHIDATHHAMPRATAAEHPPYTATSPQSETGWLSGSSSDHNDKVAKREALSPVFIDNPPRLRPDGVRKKNARFEIPEDRKVDTIDKIIMATDPNDEGLLRELKQQKRLLRNRQAALDSRSRKKEHTQKLEDERKVYMAHVERLDEDMLQHRQREAAWMAERQQWQAAFERLQLEKEELIHQHTLETADLRKKNNFLVEDASRRTSVAMSAVASSTGYSTAFSEFDHLSAGEAPAWDEFSLVNHSHAESEIPKQEMAVVHRPREERVPIKEDDKSAASGLLLTLLLCGAWVASKGAGSTAAMPQMSEDVRAASSTVLDNIYRDAGLQVSPSNNGDCVMTNTHHQQSKHPIVHQTNNYFTQPFSQLAAPTRQQQRDEVFGLSATQYNVMTTDDGLYPNNHQSTPKPRRNLQDALNALRVTNRRGSAADAYTKSLMWDEVPTNVVRDFARMVGERNMEPMSR